jgi:hypothetical protein
MVICSYRSDVLRVWGSGEVTPCARSLNRNSWARSPEPLPNEQTASKQEIVYERLLNG